MDYLPPARAARAHPDAVLEGVRSVVMVSLVYGTNDRRTAAHEPAPTAGKVARYARGGDYHRVLWDRLDLLLDWLRSVRPEARGRAVADTAPLLERDFARLRRARLDRQEHDAHRPPAGQLHLPRGPARPTSSCAYDPPHAADHCGTCTRCLDACPTDAFAGPYRARRAAMHQLLDHRAPRPDPRSRGRSTPRLGLRLRRLPGRLPVEPQGAVGTQPRTGRDARMGSSPT